MFELDLSIDDDTLKKLLTRKHNINSLLLLYRNYIKDLNKVKNDNFYTLDDKKVLSDYPRLPYAKSFFTYMDIEYMNILNLIDGLYSAINVNTLDTDDKLLINPLLLASIMRSTLEESVQLRLIFYKKEHTNLVLTEGDLKTPEEALNLLSIKIDKLIRVFTNPYDKKNKLYGKHSINDLIRLYLPSDYIDLYKKLCNYCHNSKGVVVSYDIITLLDDFEKLITPLITNSMKIYEYYLLLELIE